MNKLCTVKNCTRLRGTGVEKLCKGFDGDECVGKDKGGFACCDTCYGNN